LWRRANQICYSPVVKSPRLISRLRKRNTIFIGYFLCHTSCGGEIDAHESKASLATHGFLSGFRSSSHGAADGKSPTDRVSRWAGPNPLLERREAFRQGLRELGYIEGKNIVIEWRSGEGNSERVPALAAELVRLKVDVIVTDGSNSTRRAKEATSTIPIVMAQDTDPVGTGIVASLARPGGNITGLSNLAPELSGKRVELLKEIIPKLSRVAVFGTSTADGAWHNNLINLGFRCER
jgi:hypothetical protein